MVIVNSELLILLPRAWLLLRDILLWNALEPKAYVWLLTWSPSCKKFSICLLLSNLQFLHYIQDCEVNWANGNTNSTGDNNGYVGYVQILSSPFFTQFIWRLHQKAWSPLTSAWIWLRESWWVGGEWSQRMCFLTHSTWSVSL